MSLLYLFYCNTMFYSVTDTHFNCFITMKLLVGFLLALSQGSVTQKQLASTVFMQVANGGNVTFHK